MWRQSGAHGWRLLARELEDQGYDTLNVGDHLDGSPAPMIALMAAGEATSRLRLATMMLCNDLRNPAVLAQEAATLNSFTDGRFELGVGAGWRPHDYALARIEMQSPGRRIGSLREALRRLRELLDEGGAFAGERARRVPLVVGGGGKVILTLAAEEADTVAINVSKSEGSDVAEQVGPASVERRVGWVREAAGERWPGLELQIYVRAIVHHASVATAAARAAEIMGMSVEGVLESPYVLVGPTSHMVEALERRRARFGISCIHFGAQHSRSMAPVVEALAGR